MRGEQERRKAVNPGFRNRYALFLKQPLETNKAWIVFSIWAAAVAVLIHLSAQTYFFTSSYFSGPNLYDVWPRIDQITHALSSLALTAAILNFNLPLSFRKKWIIALTLSVLLGGIWEIAEYATAPFWGWIHVATSDTLLDLFQDFLGASFAILLYSHMVRRPRRREAWFPEINREDMEWIKRLRR
jgi:hypothetical protein